MSSNDNGVRIALNSIKQDLDAQSDSTLTDTECERLLTQWSDAKGQDDQVDKLYLRHLALRLGTGTATHLSQENLRRVYTTAKRHISPSIAETDIESIVKAASISAAALKLLHSLLSLPRGSTSQSSYLELTADDLRSTTEDLLSCTHYFPRNVSGSHARANRTQLTTSETEVTTTDAGSEAESIRSDAGNSGRRAVSSSARTVRQNAITCLSALHEAAPALMFSSWPKLLDSDSPTTTGAFGAFSATTTRSASLLTVIRDDPVLSIRLAACQLVGNLFKKAAQRGFLAAGIVEPRATGVRSAFTSLSARMGTLIASTRAFLASLLIPDPRRRTATSSTPLPPSLLEALLRCIKSLVTATRNVQLRKSHADVLREPIVQLSSHTDPSVAIAAFNLLSILSPATTVATTSNTPTSTPRPATALSGLLIRLDETTDPEILTKIWSTLCTFSRTDVAPHQALLVTYLERHLTYDDQGLRQACIAFVAAFPDNTPQYLDIMERAATDHSALVRTEVTQALGGVLLLEVKAGTTAFEELQMTKVLDRLVCDTEAVTRAGALRALGVVLAACAQEQVNNGLLDGLTDHTTRLLGVGGHKSQVRLPLHPPLSDPALLVRLRASWTLGNLCQALCAASSRMLDSQSAPTDTQPTPSTVGPILSDTSAQFLLSALPPLLQDDERIAINGLRSAGLLLSYCSDTILLQSTSLIKSLLTASEKAKSPKMKWNAVNAISMCLSSSIFRSTLADLGPQITLALSGQLSSKIFKVKLAAISGLTHVDSRMFLGSAEMQVRERLASAVQAIEGEIAQATFSEAQLHGQNTRRGLEALQVHFERLCS